MDVGGERAEASRGEPIGHDDFRAVLLKPLRLDSLLVENKSGCSHSRHFISSFWTRVAVVFLLLVFFCCFFFYLLRHFKVRSLNAAFMKLSSPNTHDTAEFPAYVSHDAHPVPLPPPPLTLCCIYHRYPEYFHAHVCTRRMQAPSARCTPCWFFFSSVVSFTGALELLRAAFRCHKRNNSPREPSVMSKRGLVRPPGVAVMAKSPAGTFGICSKCRKGRGPYLALARPALREREASPRNYVRFSTTDAHIPHETAGGTFPGVGALFSCHYCSNRSALDILN